MLFCALPIVLGCSLELYGMTSLLMVQYTFDTGHREIKLDLVENFLHAG